MFFVIGNIFKVKAVSHMACVSFVDVLNRIGGRVKLLPPQQIFFRRIFMIWFGMIQTIHVSGVELMFRNRNYSQKHSFWKCHSSHLTLKMRSCTLPEIHLFAHATNVTLYSLSPVLFPTISFNYFSKTTDIYPCWESRCTGSIRSMCSGGFHAQFCFNLFNGQQTVSLFWNNNIFAAKMISSCLSQSHLFQYVPVL